MTETDDKPPVTVLYSIGLMNRANRQTFSELGAELTQAGYPTEVDMRPPSGQFSATASLEHILIAIGAVGGGAGGAVFGKKFLELAAEDAYNKLKGKLSKLKPRKPETEKLALVITVEIDGIQVINVLAKGPDDIKELNHPGFDAHETRDGSMTDGAFNMVVDHSLPTPPKPKPSSSPGLTPS